MQKTQNKLLNNELDKQHDIVKRFFTSSNKNNPERGINEHQFLLLNLKRELDNALKTLSQKEAEIIALNKC